MGPVWSVVVAGGTGARFGRPKQFALLAGRPVVAWAVAACRPGSDGVVVVLPEGATEPRRLADADAGTAAPPYGADLAVAGGPTRAASVRAGLAAVPTDAAVVVVHDAARPLASPALFERVVGALGGEVAGALPGLEVSDTVKRVAAGPDGRCRVAATVERAGLVTVQTPQAFVAAALRAAHDGAPEATDDAALVERAGATVLVVPGDPRNLKITTPEDLVVAAALLGA